MKLKSIPARPEPAAGYALPLTMALIFIMLLAFGSIMHWVSSNSLVTERNNLYVSSQAAAESATENIITKMMRDFTYGSLDAASAYAACVPDTNGWPVLFAFASTNGAARQTSVQIGNMAWASLPSQFHGLYGSGQDCLIASVATTVGRRYDVPATVAQSVWFGTIPVFQFAIFYNQDLEINPGAAMTVNGRVHSNYNIWATGSSSGSPLTFTASVDATGFVTNSPSPLDPQNYGRRDGNSVYTEKNSPVSNADSLTLPIGTDGNNNPTNVAGILNLPPANLAAPMSAAYSAGGQVYLYNESDLIVSNSPGGIDGSSGTNVLTVYYQNANRADPLTVVAPDVQSVQTVSSNSYVLSTAYVTNYLPVVTYATNYIYYTTGKKKGQIKSVQVTSQTTYIPQVFPTTVTNVTTQFVAVTNHYYSFVTNQTFYDYREDRSVQAVEVNVAKLGAWLTNTAPTGGQQYDLMNTSGSTDKNHGINSVYVYNSAANDSSSLPGVRLTDGQRLPSSGLTVATPFPIYVKGDYNVTTDGIHYSRSLGDTAYTYPAALLGDAITILSASWKDSYASNLGVSGRPTVDIAINAATLEGIVPSNGSYYSGGVENFLRLQENWSGHTLTYNGSIVVMFPSRFATTPWGGSYYTIPTRRWGFDTNFLSPDKLPPLTPQLKATIRRDYASN